MRGIADDPQAGCTGATLVQSHSIRVGSTLSAGPEASRRAVASIIPDRPARKIVLPTKASN